jgi:hypothetical protein
MKTAAAVMMPRNVKYHEERSSSYDARNVKYHEDISSGYDAKKCEIP